MMELMGAAYILHIGEEGAIPRSSMGMNCWKVALRLRNIQSETSALLKLPTILSAAAQKVFGETTEFRNFDEMREICNSPERYTRLKIQALLVVQRIFSQNDPHPHPFFLRCLFRYNNAVFWDGNAKYYRFCVNVLNFISELLHGHQWKNVIDYDWCNKYLTTALLVITYFGWTIMEQPTDRSHMPLDSFMEVINYLSGLVFQLQKHPDPLQSRKANNFVRFMTDFIGIFVENDKQTCEEFQKWLSGYIKFTNSHPGVSTVLHSNCQSSLSPKLFQLFLQDGADPNAKDECGNTPLYYLANRAILTYCLSLNVLLNKILY